MKDLTRKRDNRDKRRSKNWKVSGRSLEHVMNAMRNRAQKGRKTPLSLSLEFDPRLTHVIERYICIYTDLHIRTHRPIIKSESKFRALSRELPLCMPIVLPQALPCHSFNL